MTQDLKSEFADAPASTVDIGRARTDGRRRLAAARLAPLGGGVAVVAACALLVGTLGGGSPAKPGAPATSPTNSHELTGTDPLVAVAAFGYLPDGYRVTSADSSTGYGPSVSAAPRQAPEKIGEHMPASNGLMLSQSPTQPKFPAYERLTPTTVKGAQKAYIVVNPGDSPQIPDDLSLIWQTSSGSWFILGGDYAIHGAQLVALLTKVAENVTTPGDPVPLPFHIEGLPKGVTEIAASLHVPDIAGVGPDIQAGVSYHTGGPAAQDAYFSVSVMAAQGMSAPTPNSTYPAIGDPSASTTAQPSGGQSTPYRPGSTQACKDSKGLRICVRDNPAVGKDALASIGGAQGLLDRITSLGTDSANWTIHVVN
jgi:hypothetical protein